MTFIKPKQKSSILNLVLATLSVAVLGGVIAMIVLYNSIVNVSHNIASAKTELDQIGVQNTDISNKVIAALGGNNLTGLVAADGLVADQTPQYFKVTTEWPIASQY